MPALARLEKLEQQQSTTVDLDAYVQRMYACQAALDAYRATGDSAAYEATLRPYALETASLEDIAAYHYADPLGFVQVTYPWGEPGTFLENETGPEEWQVLALTQIRKALLDPAQEGAIRIAACSGHGPGKGALGAWVDQWFIATRPHPQMIITANTESQLRTKTWRELAKWHTVWRFKDLYHWTATMYYRKDAPETWFAAAIPWSINKPEAFQGAHEQHVYMRFDEASAIHDVIWETAEGSMT